MSIAASFERMMDFLTPPEFKKDLAVQKRVRMFIYSHVFGPVVGLTVPLTLYFFDPRGIDHIAVLAFSIAGFWPFLILLRLFPGAYVQLSFISVCNDAFAVFWAIYHYGGTSSPFLAWLVLIPLLTFLYVGSSKVSRIFVLTLSAGGLGALFLLYQVQGFHRDFNMHTMVLPGIASTMGVIIYTYMMSLYYTQVVDNQSELVREIDRHKATLKELQQAKEAAEEAQSVAEQERTTAVLAQAEAERANEAKTAFLARMSHELRTPLNAVIGYSELLIEDSKSPRSPEEVTDLQRIGSAGRHLLAMVNDILDIAKIEAGKTQMYSEPVDLSDLIDEVVGTAKVLAKANDNDLVVDCPDDLGAIMGDGTKIRQAILNLLGNAAKFTKNGTITLAVSRYLMDGEPWMDIAVTDTGIGISAEEQARLFTNFSQANKSIGLLYGGSGLGLSLSQNLCRLMGGSISLQSTAGVGSTFTIHLPLDLGVCDINPTAGAPIIFHPVGRRPFNKRAHTLATVGEAKGEDAIDGDDAKSGADNTVKFRELTSHLLDGASRQRILICDTDQGYLSETTRKLLRLGYAPLSVDSPAAALTLVKKVQPKAILLSDRLDALGRVPISRIISGDSLLGNIPVIRIGANQSGRDKQKTTEGFLSFSSSSEELEDQLNQVISGHPDMGNMRSVGGI